MPPRYAIIFADGRVQALWPNKGKTMEEFIQNLTQNVWFNIFLLAVGFIFLAKGADFFVDGASGVAEKLKIPQIIIGLTIVAMGTSAPEAAVSISAAIEGNADITIGNIVGSNILNILIILGISSAISRLAVGKDTVFVDIPVMLGATVLLFLLGIDGEIGLVDGIVFLVVFIAYMAYLFIVARKNINKREAAVLGQGTARPLPQTEAPIADGEARAATSPAAPEAAGKEGEGDGEAKVGKKRPLILLIVMTAVGLAMIIFGSNFTVDSATFLAREMGVSERFIGLTVVALGTSLPELFTSVTAAIKKNADIAIGNIVGSNIFNILFIVGLSSVITPVPYEAHFLVDAAIAFAAAMILWVPCILNKSIYRITGIVMLVAYCGYFAYLLAVG